MLCVSFPPEINSFLITAGPGSGPLVAAATAWGALAEELETAAMGFGSVAGGLTTDWLGPSSTTMQARLEPHVAWLHNAAAQAAAAGAQAARHAGFYEQARNAMVPLSVVLANRALLSALEATNILGQNTPLIAACEAAYEVMWAQDVFCMQTYNAASTSDAPQPTTFSAPVTPTAGLGAGGIGTQVAGGLESVLTPLAGPLTAVGDFLAPINGVMSGFSNVPLLGPFAGLDLTSAVGLSNASELANGPTRLMSTPLSMLMQLSRGGSSGTGGFGGLTTGGGTNSLLDAIGEMVNGKLSGMTSGLTNQLSSWGSQIGQQVSAQLSNASRVGGLSVPDGAIQSITRALPVPPATTVSAVPTVQAGMPGGPFAQAMMGALAGRGFGGLGTVAKAGVKVAAAAKGG